MNLDFLSGLLLATAGLAVVVLLIKELVSEGAPGQKRARRYLAEVSTRLLGGKARPINDHLLGSLGTVIAHSSDGARPLRVRLGSELWPARLGSSEEGRLPIGSAVKVAAVDGAVLVVVPDDPGESPRG